MNTRLEHTVVFSRKRGVSAFSFLGILLFVFCLFHPAVSIAQTILWQPEQQISFGNDLGIPRVFASGDTVHIFWQRSLDMSYYVRSTDGGLTFSNVIPITSDSTVNSVNLAGRVAAWEQYLYLIWRTCDTCDAHHDWATFRRSTNAGETFEPYERLFPASSASGLATDDSIVAFLWLNRALTEQWLAVSFDHATTWQHIPMWFRNFQKLHLAGSYLHLIQDAQGTISPEVAYRRTTDYGITWSNEVVLSTVDNYVSDAVHARIKADEEGRVFVVWMDGKYGGTNSWVGSILLRSSTDSGSTWQPEVRLTDIPSGIHPAIGSDGTQVGVVWNNESQPFEGISLRLSTDGGVSWMPHVAVTDSIRPASHKDIAISGNRLYVVWLDRRTGLQQIWLRRGTVTVTSVEDSPHQWPDHVSLFSPYPNPFNETLVISYALPFPMQVRIDVYDILGRHVAELVNSMQQLGNHSVSFTANNLGSGVYLVRLQTNTVALTRPILLMK